MEPLVGLVGLRFFGATSALSTISASRSKQASLFVCCDLDVSETNNNSSSLVNFFPASFRNRSLAFSSRPTMALIGTNICTLELTLFTFWPPGPLEREVTKRIAVLATLARGERRILPDCSVAIMVSPHIASGDQAPVNGSFKVHCSDKWSRQWYAARS